jgi:hypothetical protein
MRKKQLPPDEQGCFPELPDQNRRWCVPDTPPRLPPDGQDEPWCFADDPARIIRKRSRSRSWLA